jgi:hypothetical protein
MLFSMKYAAIEEPFIRYNRCNGMSFELNSAVPA